MSIILEGRRRRFLFIDFTISQGLYIVMPCKDLYYNQTGPKIIEATDLNWKTETCLDFKYCSFSGSIHARINLILVLSYIHLSLESIPKRPFHILNNFENVSLN